jgi:hypothetical protein
MPVDKRAFNRHTAEIKVYEVMANVSGSSCRAKTENSLNREAG